jgi:SAM-dependent methyltransferase
MNEASKTASLRGPEFVAQYFRGEVIDIGSGPDLVVPFAAPFDLEHGDANEILLYRPREAYDCVHSSHCLEHMVDPPYALAQWWGLVKPGGHLIVVVPHEDLYEQGIWPGIFNPDHKATFRLGGRQSWSPVSHDLRELAAALSDAELISAEVHDRGYNRTLQAKGFPKRGSLWEVYRIARAIQYRMLRVGVQRQHSIWNALLRAQRRIGLPVDQTLGDALAQIQIIVRKRAKSSG